MQPPEIASVETEPPSHLDRRAVLAGGALAVGATAAALLRPDQAEAAHNTDIVYSSQTVVHADVTNTTTGSTRVSSNVAGTAAFVALNNYPVGISRPDGLLGRTAYTTSNAAGTAGSCEADAGGIGVLGTAKAADGTGVYGFAGSVVPSENSGGGVGVFGRGPTTGVLGRSTGGVGVRGETATGDAIYGSASGNGLAARLVGPARVEGPLDVTGEAAVGSVAATGAVTAASATVAGAAKAATLAVSGAATLGALALPQRSGVVTIKKGRAQVTVPVPIGAQSLALATLQRRVRGLHVEAAVPSAAKDRVVISLNRKAPRAVKVAWLVLG